MNDGEPTTLSGEVTDIFAHRFVVKTATGKVLAAEARSASGKGIASTSGAR